MDIGEKLIEFLGFGGFAWIGKVWVNKRIKKQANKHEKAMAELSAKLQKEIDRSQYQLDSLKEYSVRYSEHQFKIYTELWSELYSLMINADELWEKANNLNLNKFAEQLKKTTDQVKKNALLIEKVHLSELLNLLRKFGDYRVGKHTLINSRSNGSHINELEIQLMIENNQNLKERYSKILDELEIEFRRQLKYYVGPTKL